MSFPLSEEWLKCEEANRKAKLAFDQYMRRLYGETYQPPPPPPAAPEPDPAIAASHDLMFIPGGDGERAYTELQRKARTLTMEPTAHAPPPDVEEAMIENLRFQLAMRKRQA